MPRAKSEEKRTAILSAATRIISTEGLRAQTAAIAKGAGVANGSLFTYFDTKTELFNELYVEMKTEMAASLLHGIDEHESLREKFFQVWRNWTLWALKHPEKRRSLAQLAVSDELTADTRAAGHRAFSRIGELLEEVHKNGQMTKAPQSFLMCLMSSVADTTIDFMSQDQKRSKEHCRTGFEALWRMIS